MHAMHCTALLCSANPGHSEQLFVVNITYYQLELPDHQQVLFLSGAPLPLHLFSLENKNLKQHLKENETYCGPDIPCFLNIEKWIITKIRVTSGKTKV